MSEAWIQYRESSRWIQYSLFRATFLQELAQLWEKNCLEPLWQAVFDIMGLATEVPESFTSSARAKAPKPAARSKPLEETPEKPQSSSSQVLEKPDGKPSHLDSVETPKKCGSSKRKEKDMTPEKVGQAPKRCKAVARGRPVHFGQPRKVDPTLKSAQTDKKRKAHEEQEDAQNEKSGDVGQDPEDTLQLEDDDDDDDKRGRIHRKTHIRTCWKKPKSESTLQMLAVKDYLAGLGITWPSFQKFHSRSSAGVYWSLCRQIKKEYLFVAF